MKRLKIIGKILLWLVVLNAFPIAFVILTNIYCHYSADWSNVSRFGCGWGFQIAVSFIVGMISMIDG